jgi:hypothetical protein
LGGKAISQKYMEFTKYKIPKKEFEKILLLINKERLLVIPKVSLLGFIEGYQIFDIEMMTKEVTLITAFGTEQLPKGIEPKDLFYALCKSTQNKELSSLIDKPKFNIKEEFEDYDY